MVFLITVVFSWLILPPKESRHNDSSWHFERRSAPDVNQQDPKYTEVDCSSVRELGGQSDI